MSVLFLHDLHHIFVCHCVLASHTLRTVLDTGALHAHKGRASSSSRMWTSTYISQAHSLCSMCMLPWLLLLHSNVLGVNSSAIGSAIPHTQTHAQTQTIFTHCNQNASPPLPPPLQPTYPNKGIFELLR